MKTHFNDLFWYLGDAVEKAKMDDELITRKDLDAPLPIKAGDSVALVYANQQPALTVPIKGNKLKNLLKSLHDGLQTPLTPDYKNSRIIYPIIGNFLQSEQRIKLAKKFEQGKLTPLELLGSYRYFTGCLRREKNGVWVYGLES